MALNLKLNILPGGLFQLIRRKAHEQKTLKLHLYLDGDAWRVRSEWTPLDELQSETLEGLLVLIAAVLSERGELKLEHIASYTKSLSCAAAPVKGG